MFPNKPIKSLNGLRFLAIFVIFLHHFNKYLAPSINIDALTYGYSFVTLFFLISGFVMMYRYGLDIKNNVFNYFIYLRKRFLRVYPIYFYSLLLALVINKPKIIDLTFLKVLISNILLIQAFIPIDVYHSTLNFVGWFLSALFICYLLFPILGKIVRNLFLKSAIIVLLLILGLYALDIIVTGHIVSSLDLNLVIYRSPLTHLVEFFIGILLYFIYLKIKDIYFLNTFTWTIIEILVLLFYLPMTGTW